LRKQVEKAILSLIKKGLVWIELDWNRPSRLRQQVLEQAEPAKAADDIIAALVQDATAGNQHAIELLRKGTRLYAVGRARN
jgi:hypothetical protein